MRKPIHAEVYTVQAASGETIRYVVLVRVDLGIKEFVGLIREEVFDRTCELESIDAYAIAGGEAMVWAEETPKGLIPLSPAEARVIEDHFQGQLADSLEEDGLDA